MARKNPDILILNSTQIVIIRGNQIEIQAVNSSVSVGCFRTDHTIISASFVQAPENPQVSIIYFHTAYEQYTWRTDAPAPSKITTLPDVKEGDLDTIACGEIFCWGSQVLIGVLYDAGQYDVPEMFYLSYPDCQILTNIPQSIGILPNTLKNRELRSYTAKLFTRSVNSTYFGMLKYAIECSSNSFCVAVNDYKLIGYLGGVQCEPTGNFSMLKHMFIKDSLLFLQFERCVDIYTASGMTCSIAIEPTKHPISVTDDGYVIVDSISGVCCYPILGNGGSSVKLSPEWLPIYIELRRQYPVWKSCIKAWRIGCSMEQRRVSFGENVYYPFGSSSNGLPERANIG